MITKHYRKYGRNAGEITKGQGIRNLVEADYLSSAHFTSSKLNILSATHSSFLSSTVSSDVRCFFGLPGTARGIGPCMVIECVVLRHHPTPITTNEYITYSSTYTILKGLQGHVANEIQELPLSAAAHVCDAIVVCR